MVILAASALMALLLAGILGWWKWRAGIWRHADLIYYPLGALGVILLFISSATQRQVGDLALAIDSKKQARSALVASRQSMSRESEEKLFKVFLPGYGRTPERSALSCRLSNNTNYDCASGPKVWPIWHAFRQSTIQPKDAEPEAWHQAVCERAMSFLTEIRDKGALPRLVADEMIEHYSEALQKNFKGIFTWDKADAFVKSLSVRVAEKAISNATRLPERQLIAIRADAQFAVEILDSLRPCIVELEGRTWFIERKQLDTQIVQLEEKMKSVRERYQEEHPWVALLRLWIWPYIIVAALALKFAKAVAGLHSDRLSGKRPAALQAELDKARHIRRAPLRALGFRDKPLPGRRK